MHTVLKCALLNGRGCCSLYGLSVQVQQILEMSGKEPYLNSIKCPAKNLKCPVMLKTFSHTLLLGRSLFVTKLRFKSEIAKLLFFFANAYLLATPCLQCIWVCGPDLCRWGAFCLGGDTFLAYLPLKEIYLRTNICYIILE